MVPLPEGESQISNEVYPPSKAIRDRAHLGSMEAYQAM